MPKGLIKKRKGTWKSSDQGWRKGREDGYSRGWSYGYHVGWSETILRQKTVHDGSRRDVKVLYISAGIDVPYPALDQAIIEALSELVRDVEIANPSEDVLKLIESVKPDLVLVLNGVAFPTEQVKTIRERGIKTAIWLTDDPYYTDWTMSIAPEYDYVFTLELSCVSFYNKLGCAQVHYLPFAANPKVFHPKQVESSYHTDICFIGTAFWNRVELIDSIADYLSDKNVVISGWWWDRLKNYAKLAGKIRLGEWMSPEETASCYNGAKIVINMHRLSDDDSINFNSKKIPALSLNPRSFEISACGTVQLTDVRQDLGHYYTPGYEIATYASADELIGQINYFLNHEQVRREMAARALSKTLDEHTYHHRLTRMLNIILDD